MKAYRKMKAAIVDLSEVLDEAVAFDAYVKKMAYAGVTMDNGRTRQRATRISDWQDHLDSSRFTTLVVS